MLNADSQPSYPHPIEVLLVDDHHDVRRLLRDIIETYKDLSIVGEAVNGEEAVLLAAKLKPAAVVMDIHLRSVVWRRRRLSSVNNPFVSFIALTAGDPHEDGHRWSCSRHQQGRSLAHTISRHHRCRRAS
jgi:CheY-like chemotaxis protein